MSGRPKLARRLLLEGADRVADGAGGFAESWAALGHLWAEVLPRTGREAADVARMGYRITVRAAGRDAPSRPRPGQRFRDGARLFRIEAVAERDPEGRYLICYASEERGA